MKSRERIASVAAHVVPLFLVLFGCRDSAPADSPADGNYEPADETTAAIGPQSSSVEPTMDEGWCGGHGVPESVCTRCNDSLIPKFTKGGDWCAEHALPESQCTICHPDVATRWAAWRSKPPVAEDSISSNIRVEPSHRLLDGANDPLCPVDTVRVRFADSSIVRKAGIEIERARRRAMSAIIEMPAEVEFDATALARVTARVSGVVQALPVHIGDVTNANDLLATVDSPVLGEAKSHFIERSQDLKLADADFRRVDTIARGVGKMLEICTPEATMNKTSLASTDSPTATARLINRPAIGLRSSKRERSSLVSLPIFSICPSVSPSMCSLRSTAASALLAISTDRAAVSRLRSALKAISSRSATNSASAAPKAFRARW